MSVIEELPDDYEGPLPDAMPDLPPLMAEDRHQSVDELVRDLKRSPFFMTSIDDAGDEPNPELDAIKALMYEGTRAENAENFREQGNEFAREKKWKDGKELYTQGLKALKQPRKDEDRTGAEEDEKEAKCKALLLVNRALCHLELQNYRSCILDSYECIGLDPSNVKAYYRMASALFKLVKLSEARTTAAAGLKRDPSNKALASLLEKVEKKQAEQDTIERRKREQHEQLMREKEALAEALKKRGIKSRKSAAGTAPDLPDDAVMRLQGDKTSPDSNLLFPVMVLYPLHMESDFIKAFDESHTLAQHLDYLLPPPWDSLQAYSVKDVEVYMDTIAGGLVKWGKNVTLGTLLGGGKVEVLDGILRVNFVPKSRANEWIESLRKKKKEQT